MELDEKIQVVPYDERWTERYQREKANLLSIFEDEAIDIQHFGSTAVQGMTAKPIVDILIGVKTLALSGSVTGRLTELGYDGFGEAGVSGRLYYRKRQAQAYNLAVVVWNGEHWRNNLLLRDYLRNHPDAAKQYAERKLAAVRSGYTTLLAYSDDKAEYVAYLLAQARTDE